MHEEDILDLAPREKTVRIAGETFTLTEMSGKDLHRYTYLISQSATATFESIRKMRSPKTAHDIRTRVASLAKNRTLDDEAWMLELYSAMTPGDMTTEKLEKALADAAEIVERGSTEIFKMLLGRDADWINANLTGSMRNKILEVQNDLNGTEELLKKVQPLLSAAVS